MTKYLCLAMMLLYQTIPATGQTGYGPEVQIGMARMHFQPNKLYTAAQSQAQYAGMGTTLVLVLFHGAALTVAHVGDSRLYRLRRGRLSQLTRDHSLLQEQLDRGIIKAEDARHAQNRNLVTRALGVDPDVEPDVASHEVRRGDIYLLCSDGLNDMIEDAEIEDILHERGRDLALAATELVQRANDSGGRDNVSVILVRVGGTSGWLDRARAWLARAAGV